ncbi:MAG: mycothiol system anti-sigma-R factor [Candidatus Limnocylindria bacterium]
MNCTECIERLYAFLDQELPASEREAIRAHLTDCGDCDDEFVFERRFLEHVRDSCTGETAPGAVRERIVVRLAELRRGPGPTR